MRFEIQPHTVDNDSCHICGLRHKRTADVWYAAPAKNDGPLDNYIRVCVPCAAAIALAATSRYEVPAPQPQE